MPSTKTPFPSASQAALLLLAGFLFQYLVSALLHDFRQLSGLTSAQSGTMTMLLSNGLLIAAVVHVLGLGYRDILHPSTSSPAATFVFLVPPVLLLLPLVLLLDIVLIGAIEAVFPVSSWEQQAFNGMAESTLPAVVAACILAPVLEEMLFRGILLRAFLERYPRGLAIGYSALYFGAAHLNLYQFVLAFLVGLLLGWLYERSRSLLPCMALHAALNVSVSVWEGLSKGAFASDDPFAVPASVWFAAAAAAAVGTWALRRLLGRRPGVRDAA